MTIIFLHLEESPGEDAAAASGTRKWPFAAAGHISPVFFCHRQSGRVMHPVYFLYRRKGEAASFRTSKNKITWPSESELCYKAFMPS